LKGYYTVAVVVDRSTLKTSSNGKNYIVLLLSDLTRYNILQVQKSLEVEFKDNKDKLKIALKSYSNGYKALKFMAFGDAAKKAGQAEMKPGTIVAVMNPRKMESKQNDKF